MKKFKKAMQIFRILLILPGIHINDEKLAMDIARWKKIQYLEGGELTVLAMLMWDLPEFRNLFLYRNRFRRIYRTWAGMIYRPMNTLFIQAREIGGGLYIQHGFATMITAEEIGENCWINQQVTIGYRGKDRAPIIGDNVMITCGAKILGDIRVGSNAVIGANAVVIKDVEPGAVMGGVPAKRIK